MSARCHSCGAAVVWITVKPGNRRMPVDAEPSPRGNILVDRSAGMGVVLTPRALESFREIDAERGTDPEPLFLSHFATCPQARQWRKS